MFTFDKETLKYLLNKIKDQLDKRQSKQQYLMPVNPEEEGALIIGTDVIDEKLVNASELPEGTAVVIKDMVMTEVNFTLEETKSVCITPAHCGSFQPLRNVHAFTSISPAVMNVCRFSRV